GVVEDDGGGSDWDQSGNGIGGIVEALGLDNRCESDEIDPPAVRRLARTLQPMTWGRVAELAPTLGLARITADADYVRPYYDAFRELVIASAKAGHAIGIETL